MFKFTFSLLLAGLSAAASAADVKTAVLPSDISNGYYVQKIWLEHYQLPRVHVKQASFLPVGEVPAGAGWFHTDSISIILGKERKRPFALVKIPAYLKEDHSYGRLMDVELEVTETTAPESEPAPQRPTSSNSVLSSGDWYKIGARQRGLYKIDFDFIKNKLGVNPAGINPANIRLYGNGGTMIPEDNAVVHPMDLTENAVWINDGGDGKFDQGDYIVFYANGPMSWEPDAAGKGFIHHNNLYEDTSYYFIGFGQAAGKRISTVAGTQAGNIAVDHFDDYTVHDEDKTNIGRIGKVWWGEKFSGQAGSSNVSIPLAAAADSVSMHVHFGCVSNANNNIFTVSVNSIQQYSYYCAALPMFVGSPLSYYTEAESIQSIPLHASSVNCNISFQPGTAGAEGYLDYIEINYRRPLNFAGGQTFFRDRKSVNNGNIATYQVGGANSNLQIWDISDPLAPVKINGTLNGNTYSFSRDAATLHEFAAFDGSNYNTPDFAGKTGNQNLHGLGQADYIIITHPDFTDAAGKLADFHRQHDNLRVVVATTSQVYNEFGSGSKDPAAIRDFLRMFYDRAGNDSTQMPRYALLLGDASFDYKYRLPGNTGFVPTFQSAQSADVDYSYTGDDFFAFLDDNENAENYNISNTLDIGIGRLPVENAAEANAIADKIIHYKSAATLGPWRISDMYVADNEDGAGEHLREGNDMSLAVSGISPIYNHTKIYLDNMNFVSTPGGARCPDANKAINDQVFRGAFFMNYTGHGNIYTLAHERILTSDDFNAWKNKDKLPFMVTATCDFSRFDDPSYRSAGEKLVLKTDGGAIAMLTTTQAVYSDKSHAINLDFLQTQFTRQHSSWYSFGDAFRLGKNYTYAHNPPLDLTINTRKFTLLGDPALTPDFPRYDLQTDAIKNTADGSIADTIKALGEYTVEGSVTEGSQLLGNFNGRLYVTIFDKARTIQLSTQRSPNRVYDVQNNIVYRGKATVKNGKFSFSFIAPKDINYDFGSGKISYYAEDGSTDAAGADGNIVIGGYADHPRPDNAGPVVKPYMNDSLFLDGGITGANSVLFVSLYDQSGINVSGNSVGHDLTAILDDNVEIPYTLNDYYETAANDYTHGYVSFPVTGLPDGEHHFTVKAWDVYNNSGQGTVHFKVVDGNVVQLGNLFNYPNPFSDITHFVFEHNHPNENLKAQLYIYSLSGAMVRAIVQDFSPTGSRSREITWDGTGSNGAKLPAGMYVYKLNIITNQGIESTAYQKLILLR